MLTSARYENFGQVVDIHNGLKQKTVAGIGLSLVILLAAAIALSFSLGWLLGRNSQPSFTQKQQAPAVNPTGVYGRFGRVR